MTVRWQAGLLVGPLLLCMAAATFAVYGDIQFQRRGSAPEDATEIPPALFPHWFHRIRFRCSVCHAQIFEMRRGASQITMDAIREGKFCGSCHNGKVAWGLSYEVCDRCHVPPQ